MTEINLAIRNGLSFIGKEIKKNVFLGYETPFVSILIGQCLNTINLKDAKEIVKLEIEELLKEKSEYWSFNYWLKKSDKYKSEPYPDDLDDTFCALELIYSYNPKLISGQDLALIIELLLACENEIGGPYKTWLVTVDKEKKWSDVDLAVNCNIGYFLKSQSISLESINSLVEKAMDKDELISPYYKGKWPIIYFASRFYQGKEKLKLSKIIEKNIDEKNSVMEKAMALSSLIRLGNKDGALMTDLANQITEIKQWQSEDFYLYIDGNRRYIGDKSLTAALVIEALNLFNQQRLVDNSKNVQLIEKIVEKLKEILNDLGPETKKQFDQIFQKITKNENAEMILLSPFVVAKNVRENKKLDEKFLVELGVISALGWMAYTIYDDLMDGDKPMSWLPMANIICREMDIKFTQLLPKEKPFLKEYKKTMMKLEEANFWELNNCRNRNEKIPNFDKVKKLSDRSMGHALTSMAILYKVKASKEDILKMKMYFRFFLAARQMNDDAHDWESDLKHGQINSAAAEILKLVRDTGNYDELRLVFWEKVFDKYAERIFNYCEKAKSIIKQITCLKNTDDFDRMVDKVIKSTQLALDEKKQTIEFINNYYKK